MKGKSAKSVIFRCSYGSVEYKAIGEPIQTAACHCDDCQRGSRDIESLPNAPRILDSAGGSGYVQYRRDRIECLKGESFLQERRIDGESFTKRVVASCCHSAMFLDFEKGHWLSFYRSRFVGEAPPIQMRIQTKYIPEGAQVPDAVPCYPGFPFRFISRLLGSKIAMTVGL
jgi:hypothetical protein